MEKIYIIYFILLLFNNIFRRGKLDTLYCGLFGFVGSEEANLNKIKILGLYNLERGKDSCGIFYNDKLQIGVDRLKCFDALLEEDNFILAQPKEAKNKVFIGHTRSGTVGSNTKENAHPHIINYNKILAHNGTISNIWVLCNKYGVNHSNLHNDSKALGILIDKIGFKILDEYVGFAAILWHDQDEPNTMYIFHGASRAYAYQTSLLEEERPLFYMTTKEGMYFSSLEKSLKAIRDNKNQLPVRVECNKVIKVTADGEYEIVYEVNREWNNSGGVDKKSKTQSNIVHTPAATKKSIDELFDDNKKYVDISQETYPIRYFKLLENNDKIYDNFVTFIQGRYDDNYSNNMSGKSFINKQGCIIENTDESEEKVNIFYFWKGVLIDTVKNYNKIVQAHNLNNKLGDDLNSNFAKEISKYSKYPVSNSPLGYSVEENKSKRDIWYFNGRLANGSYRPKFSDRDYIFEGGVLIEIKPQNPNDVYVLKDEEVDLYINFKSINTYTEDSVDSSKQEFIEKLYSYCENVYNNISDFTNNVPVLIKNAIQLYVEDILDATALKPNKEIINNYYDDFVNIVVNNGFTIYDNVKSKEDFNKYIQEAVENLEDFNEDVDEEDDDDNVDEGNTLNFHDNFNEAGYQKLIENSKKISNEYDEDGIKLETIDHGYKKTISVKKKKLC